MEKKRALVSGLDRRECLRLGALLVAPAAASLAGCAPMESRAAKSTLVVGRLRIAVAYLQHEATTFSSETVGIDGFAKPNLVGPALLAQCEEIQGFVQFASEHADVGLVPLESPGVVIGGSSKGWVEREAFEHYLGLMIRDLRASLPVDAVYLALHGALAVEGIARPEAELARRFRAVVGPRVPIAATFDPHANEDEEFLHHANFSLVMKYYPHYDGRLQGERAARLLIRTARGDYVPTTATRKPGILTPTVVQWTGRSPWMDIVQRALTWEARKRDAYVSVCFGYPWSDVPDVGATIQVMTNNDPALAEEIAEDMAQMLWRRRREMIGAARVVAPAAAVAEAREAITRGATPVVLADYSDRTGDATHLLREIVRQDLSGVLYASLRDERVITELAKTRARAGDGFDQEVGGYVLQPDSGKPVRITGKLVYFGDAGVDALASELGGQNTIAIVEFGRGNWLVLTSVLLQVTEPASLTWAPIDLRRVTTWAVKSRVHFRRGFDDSGFAKTILIVDAPAPYLGTVHLDKLPYRNVDLARLFPYRPDDAAVPR